jgi:hypothetical protein
MVRTTARRLDVANGILQCVYIGVCVRRTYPTRVGPVGAPVRCASHEAAPVKGMTPLGRFAALVLIALALLALLAGMLMVYDRLGVI